MIESAVLNVGKDGEGQENDGEVIKMVWVDWHECREEKVGN